MKMELSRSRSSRLTRLSLILRLEVYKTSATSLIAKFRKEVLNSRKSLKSQSESRNRMKV